VKSKKPELYLRRRFDDFLKNPNIMTSNPVAIVTPEEEVQDIDTLADWKMAEMKYKLIVSFCAKCTKDSNPSG